VTICASTRQRCACTRARECRSPCDGWRWQCILATSAPRRPTRQSRQTAAAAASAAVRGQCPTGLTGRSALLSCRQRHCWQTRARAESLKHECVIRCSHASEREGAPLHL
jgi:hypothetical protein